MKLEVSSNARELALLRAIQKQSESLLAFNAHDPRFAGVFATQHRWLMAHIGLALYFRQTSDSGHPEFSAAGFLEAIQHHKVTSRNTAAAFLAEMMKYGILTKVPHRRDRRIGVLVPTELTIEAFIAWVKIHLATLDRLDGGRRGEINLTVERLSRFQPLVAEGLLQNSLIRQPPPALTHFMSVNNGFLIMERLIHCVETRDDRQGRCQTSLRSIQDVVSGFRLSRSHSARKIGEGEALGIVGWDGAKGRSNIWVSTDFVDSFLLQQKVKLSIIDKAFAQQVHSGARC